MNIKKELEENQIILLLMPSAGYNTSTIEILKRLSGSNICYVTLNKTYESLREHFLKNAIDAKKMYFIDCISKTIKEITKQGEDCYYVESPAALTELSLAITKALERNFDYFIFDSLVNLLVYEKRAPIAKFVSVIANRIRETKTKAIIYTLSIKEQDELIKESGMFVDKVIDLSEEKVKMELKVRKEVRK